ncbi:MBL fold metallo-hydrolase [Roseovarius aestuariivivens]|uniref:MBL fold metallo-hydrolase n=1 Tax=Roseovarius aestuariivivens TaxID=1888910 RepID=UPI001080BDAD|nr:MBL fold metallo-hydrolase [Roseovarius aestuariivivens]
MKDQSPTPQTVTLLGTKGGPAIRPGTPMPSATLLRLDGQALLVDAGLGAAAGVVRAGLPLEALDAVVITHLHSDHVLELGPLLHTAWTGGLTHPIPIFGPPGIETYWQGFLDSMALDIETRMEDEGRPDFYELFPLAHLSEARAVDIDGIVVSAMANHHPPLDHSFALRIDAAQHSVVLSGDTAPLETMAAFAQGCDLLVHEAMLPDAMQALAVRAGATDDRLLAHLMRSHTPAAAAGRIAAAADVGALALNHLLPADDPTVTEDDWHAAIAPHYDGPLFIGHDGMVIDLTGGV